MKIPLIVAQQQVGVPHYPRMPVGGNGTAAVGAAIGGNVAQGLAVMAEAQQAKEQQFAKDEAADASSRFELRVKTFDKHLQMLERDPETYGTRFAKEITDAEAEISKDMKTEAGRALFSAKVKAARTTLEPGAIGHANSLYKDRADGLGLDTIERQYQMAGQVPMANHAQWQAHYREAAASIEGRRWLHGDKATSEALAANRQRFFLQRAYQHAQSDPDGFLAQADTLYGGNPKTGEPGLDSHTRDKFYERAQTEGEQRRKRARDESDRAVKESREIIASDLRERIEGGEDLQADIGALSRELGEQQHKELLSLNRALRDSREALRVKGNTDAAKAASESRRTLLTAAIYDGSITRTRDVLSTPDLQPDDTTALLGLLRAEKNRKEDEALAARDKLIQDGLVSITDRLRTRGPLDFDALGSEITARAKNLYVTRARKDESLDPQAFAREIIDQHAPALISRHELGADDVAQIIEINPDLAQYLSVGRRATFEKALPERFRTGDPREAITAEFQKKKLTRQEADKYFRIWNLLNTMAPTKPVKPGGGTVEMGEALGKKLREPGGTK